MHQIDPTDIWRAANLMIELFAEKAELQAAIRADALLEEGDAEGFSVWRRISRAIRNLSNKMASEHDLLN